MPGIFDLLPDASASLDVRANGEVRWGDALGRIPQRPEDLLGDLPARLEAIRAALAGDSSALVAPLADLLGGIAGDLDVDFSGDVSATLSALSGLHAELVAHPIAQLVLAPAEARDLAAIVSAQLPEIRDRFLVVFREMVERILPDADLQALLDFTAAIERFASGLPAEPAAVADVLARAFIGVPRDLLAGALAAVEPALAGLEQAAALAGSSGAPAAAAAISLRIEAAARFAATVDLSSAADLEALRSLLAEIGSALGAVRTDLQAALSGVTGALAGVDLGRLPGALRTALAAIPDIHATSLDDLVAALRAPLLELDRILSSVDPDALIAGLHRQLAALAAGLEETRLSEWQRQALGFFDDIRARIEGLGLSALRDQFAALLAGVEQEIAAAGGDLHAHLVAAVRAPLDQVDRALDGLDLVAVQGAIDAIFGEIEGALDALPLDDLASELQSALSTLSGLLDDLAAQTASLSEQVHAVADRLSAIQFDPVTDQVIAEIDELKTKLQGIDPDQLSPLAKGALAAALVILKEIDFEVSVTGVLLTAFDASAAPPREKLGEVAGVVDALVARARVFDPEALLEPIRALSDQLRAGIEGLDLSPALAPLRTAGPEARAALALLSPERLRVPLSALFAPVDAALAPLSPAVLLAPLSARFGDVRSLLAKLDLGPLLGELTALLDDLFAQIKGELLDRVRSLGLPAPLVAFLDTLTPLLDLAAPATLVDPAPRLLRILDTALASFRPGDLLRPLGVLHDRLRAGVRQLAEADAVAAFERVRADLVDAIDRIDPARLPGSLSVRAHAAAGFTARLDPAALAGALAGPHQALAAAVTGRDEATVPAPLRPAFDAIRNLVSALDPATLFGGLGAGFVEISARLDTSATLDLGDLAASFAPVVERIQGLVPDLLRQPVTPEAIGAALDAFSPAIYAADLDAVYDRFREKLAALRPRIAAELESFAATSGAALGAFDLGALVARLDAAFGALRTQIAALDPMGFAAVLQTTFDGVRDQIAALQPTFLVDELGATFTRIEGKLAAFDPGPIADRVEDLWDGVSDRVLALDPLAALEAAGVLDKFHAVEKALASLSFTAALELLDGVFVALRAELEQELERTAAAFSAMLDAAPASLSVEIGV